MNKVLYGGLLAVIGFLILLPTLAQDEPPRPPLPTDLGNDAGPGESTSDLDQIKDDIEDLKTQMDAAQNEISKLQAKVKSIEQAPNLEQPARTGSSMFFFMSLAALVIALGVIGGFMYKKKKEKPAPEQPPAYEEEKKEPSTDPILVQYFKDYIGSGYTADQLKQALKAQGYNDNDINSAMSEAISHGV